MNTPVPCLVSGSEKYVINARHWECRRGMIKKMRVCLRMCMCVYEFFMHHHHLVVDVSKLTEGHY